MKEKGLVDRSQVERWMIAYWCFYSAGVSSHMSEKDGSEFWDEMEKAALNTEQAPTGGRWDRASERRHFRGAQAVDAIDELRHKYGHRPSSMVDWILETEGDGPPTFQQISENVRTHRGFGSWISFKVADMLDRVLDENIQFLDAEVMMFDEPRKSALMIAERYGLYSGTSTMSEEEKISWSVQFLKNRLDDLRSPPAGDRPLGIQEFETILCKWKSHQSGKYDVGHDIIEIRSAIQPWAKRCRTAAQFLEQMPCL